MSIVFGQHKAQVTSGSLAAASFVGFTQIVSRGGEISAALHGAIFFFALGIPLLLGVVISDIETPEQEDRADRLLPAMLAIWLLPVVGVGCMFAHYSYHYLAIYIISIFLAAVLMRAITVSRGGEGSKAGTPPDSKAS